MIKIKPSPRVSNRGALKKQADDFMIEFGRKLAKLNEQLKLFSEDMMDLLGNCAMFETNITSIAQEISDMRQKIMLVGEHMSEMNDRMTKIEPERTKPTCKAPIFAPSFSDIE